MKQKQKYVAPGLTVVEFRTERGFADSGNPIFSAAQQINAMTDEMVQQQVLSSQELSAGYFENQDMTNPTGNWVYDGNGGAGGSWF